MLWPILLYFQVLPLEKLSPTPSAKDGLSEEAETMIRSLGCDLIQIAGRLLRLPQVQQVAILGKTTFNAYFNVFRLQWPLDAFSSIVFTMPSRLCVFLLILWPWLLLAWLARSKRIPVDLEISSTFFITLSKSEGASMSQVFKSLLHEITIFVHRPIQPMLLDSHYVSLKNQVIKAERRILKELGFCVHVKHPHKVCKSVFMIHASLFTLSVLCRSLWRTFDSCKSKTTLICFKCHGKLMFLLFDPFHSQPRQRQELANDLTFKNFDRTPSSLTTWLMPLFSVFTLVGEDRRLSQVVSVIRKQRWRSSNLSASSSSSIWGPPSEERVDQPTKECQNWDDSLDCFDQTTQ